MSSLQRHSKIFEEIAALFASAPSANEILQFRLSDQSRKRTSELLDLNRRGQLSEPLVQELDQIELIELLIRLVKARIRSAQNESTDLS